MPLETPFPSSPLADLLVYDAEACDPQLFSVLDEQIQWQQDAMHIYGKAVPLPRLTAWYGDPEAVYQYSGIRNQPRPWLPLLQDLRQLLEERTGARYNSVLANRYAHGGQHQGYHADDEKELGPTPTIASLSFGAMRRFLIQERASRERWHIDLAGGSLLLMRGDFQRNFRHALARTKKPVGPRINLTFRWIQSLELKGDRQI